MQDQKEKDSEEEKEVVKFLPMISSFQRKYGNSCDGNDQKASRLFKEYESFEQVRRLQQELQWIKKNKVSEKVLDEVVGKKRYQRYQGYDHWANLMLQWLTAKS